MRASALRVVLLLPGVIAVLLAVTLVAADATEYELGPGELDWNELEDVLPVPPGEPFTVVFTTYHVPCFDETTGEPIPESERDVAFERHTLEVDGQAIGQEGVLLPCQDEPAHGDTAAAIRYAFPEGLEEGSHTFVASFDTQDVDSPWVETKTLEVLPAGGGDHDGDGGDAVDGDDTAVPDRPDETDAADHDATDDVGTTTQDTTSDVVVPQPSRVDAGAGGQAGPPVPGLLLLVVTGVVVVLAILLGSRRDRDRR